MREGVGVCGKVIDDGQNRWEGGRLEALELMRRKREREKANRLKTERQTEKGEERLW